MNFELLKPILLEETDSTNGELMRMLKHGRPPEGTCVCTGYQTAGRGQRSNQWHSKAGENLLASFILYPPALLASRPFLLSKAVALAVRNAIAAFTSHSVKIKWPNDILLSDKKVAGVLIENQWLGTAWHAAIVGIGINVNQQNFELAQATSIRQHTGQPIEINYLLEALQRELSRQYTRCCNDQTTAVENEYQRYLFGTDGYYNYETMGDIIKGRVVRVLEDGKLELQLPDHHSIDFDLSEIRLIY